jgi:hypothetical protein
MIFRVGDRVKVKDEVLAKMLLPSITKLGGVGQVTQSGETLTRVRFPSVSGYWLRTYQLESVKNTQLLFDFYTE